MYKQLEKELEEFNNNLHGAFPGFPMHNITVNTGLRVATPLHVDFKNALFGMCILAVFGKFNHKMQGLLILRELKVMLQVAPGDIVFLPSALLTHGNTELAPTDIRRSWTLFTSGGLFRFRDMGCTTAEALKREGRGDCVREFEALYPALFKEYMSSYMTLDDIVAFHTKL